MVHVSPTGMVAAHRKLPWILYPSASRSQYLRGTAPLWLSSFDGEGEVGKKCEVYIHVKVVKGKNILSTVSTS